MARIASGFVRLRRSLLPRTSRFQASKRAPRNSCSSSLSVWIIVPMAPSSTRMRSRASARSSASMGEMRLCTDIAANSASLPPLPIGERAGVRGARTQLLKRFCNRLKHAVSIFQYIVVPKSQHEISHRLQYLGALCVLHRLDRVLTAVELDNEAGITAAEVGDVA